MPDKICQLIPVAARQAVTAWSVARVSSALRLEMARHFLSMAVRSLGM